MRVGVDTGGTFTDLVADDGRIVKVPSTATDPGDAVRRAVATVTSTAPDVLAHGTTVATNALLERAIGRVALVTNRGFADEIEIARRLDAIPGVLGHGLFLDEVDAAYIACRGVVTRLERIAPSG